ncbi:hypothetical protein KUTeg_000507 [Tegillarca granosa]|uniref:Acyl-coenzyme A oxidase n=1 Tax=Tegillarca granosa TaxID=220873 RepID=A0ABQ9FZ41_TEGGR|nr:hypothetical protein KUTeg_000507 [Tegillarca granosa]
MTATSVTVNEDIARERNNATFDTEKLTCYLYGSPEKVRRKRYIQNLVVSDPFFKQCKPWAFCTREEEYELALKKHLYANQKTKELGITSPLEVQYYKECASSREMDPFGLHVGAFMTTIEAQGTKEQKQKWLPPSENLQVIGTYGQTELGHVGKTVNHCVVMAQLYTQGICYGIHAFIVQLRSLKDHSSLPGVELGDIGPKMGFNGNDNGFLRFHNYRIPRENMLMRYSKVLEDGTYVAPPNSRLSYGSMVMAAELQVLDYQTQQYKLLPLVAASYAINFASRQINDIYAKAVKEMEQGNFDALPQLHAISSGMKAFSAWICSAGVEVCRMACGGHGYSHASGLPKIYSSVAYLNQDLNNKSCMTKDVALNCLIKAYEHRSASFVETINSKPVDTNVHKALTSLCKLYGVHGVMENLGEFIMDGFLSGDQVDYVNSCLFDVLAEVRRNAVAFVDAFDYPDRMLDSCLGRYDGQVYQALYEFAKSSPFNASDDCKPWPFRDREEAYDTALKKNVHVEQQIHMLGLTDPDDKQYYRECAFPREIAPFGLHFDAFMTTIESQGTEEQKQKWLPPAQQLQIIGTYGQTELGHGTFLRGLETTATYDPKTKEFVLNSPKLTSIKYWPGNLGKTVNHCIIMAQLYTKGKRHGMHPFVLEDGTYVAPQNPKLTYGSMVKLRSGIVLRSADCLAMACVIAVRYSAIRRQTEKSPGGEELQILDYQTQQYKLFPLVATAYAMRFVGRQMSNIYLDINKEITQGNLDSLSELHALSAGLKAFSSWTCSAGVEVCRLSCGGHGYSHASGLSKIYSTIAPACTYDGENTAHCHLYVFDTFIKTTNIVQDVGCRDALTSLCKLYGDSYLSATQVELIHKTMESLLVEIRRNAVTFVDAFDYPDAILGSCLGRYDGQVYQALYEYAKLSPLNKTDVSIYIQKFNFFVDIIFFSIT